MGYVRKESGWKAHILSSNTSSDRIYAVIGFIFVNMFVVFFTNVIFDEFCERMSLRP